MAQGDAAAEVKEILSPREPRSPVAGGESRGEDEKSQAASSKDLEQRWASGWQPERTQGPQSYNCQELNLASNLNEPRSVYRPSFQKGTQLRRLLVSAS